MFVKLGKLSTEQRRGLMTPAAIPLQYCPGIPPQDASRLLTPNNFNNTNDHQWSLTFSIQWTSTINKTIGLPPVNIEMELSNFLKLCLSYERPQDPMASKVTDPSLNDMGSSSLLFRPVHRNEPLNPVDTLKRKWYHYSAFHGIKHLSTAVMQLLHSSSFQSAVCIFNHLHHCGRPLLICCWECFIIFTLQLLERD